MAEYEIDAEDAAVMALFTLGSAASVGIANVELFGHTFQDVITTIAGADLQLASVVAGLAFASIVVTNEVGMEDIKDLDDNYYYAVIGTAALILGIPFIPQVHDFVTSNDVLALLAVAIQSAGAFIVGWMA